MGCSNVYTREKNTRVPGSGWPSANESWIVIMGASGSNPSPEKDPPSTSRSLPDEAPGRARILVVEDSKTDAYLIREAINQSRIDADIDVLRDGHAATKYFDEADASESMPCPDLVLLDLNLPKTSGDEVLKHLRASVRCRYAKVVIVSSSDTLRDHKAVASLAVADYFKKPSSYAEFMKLGTIVERLLRNVD